MMIWFMMIVIIEVHPAERPRCSDAARAAPGNTQIPKFEVVNVGLRGKSSELGVGLLFLVLYVWGSAGMVSQMFGLGLVCRSAFSGIWALKLDTQCLRTGWFRHVGVHVGVYKYGMGQLSACLSLSRDTRDMVCYIRTSTLKIEKIDMPYRGVT